MAASPEGQRQFDVCIIGAGPGALSTLSAVLEPYSLDDLGSDQATRAAYTVPPKQPSVCVVDPKPWLSGWRERFAALDISWLRSPAMAHPDSFDAWGLLAFAHSHGRKEELQSTSAEHWKTVKGLGSAQAGLFSLPSSQLFLDYCDTLASKLPHEFVQAKATSVRPTENDAMMEVGLCNGSKISAGAVVLALGAPGPATIPAAFKELPSEVVFHSERAERLHQLPKGSRVLVVGGGLTAAQAAQLAMKRGCKVSICSRRRLVTRPFDIPLEWFDYRSQGRFRHQFWDCDPEARLQRLRAIKGGGSVPLPYMEQLKASVAAGKLEMIHGQVEAANVEEGRVRCWLAGAVEGESRLFDRVVLACGHQPACSALPLVKELQAQWPVQEIGGLPVISKDLQWGENKRLYVVGALAALQVGPDAANLMGCRNAAKVVAQSLGLRLWQRTSKPKDGSISIRGNRYAALSDSEEEEDDEESTAESTDAESQGSSSESSS